MNSESITWYIYTAILNETISMKTFHPYRPAVWYVPDQGMGYTILDT